MLGFRIHLAVIWTVLLIYTAVVVANHGWNLFPDFFGDMSELTWPGQFNLDFMGFLSLSALWLAWRHEFSPMGLLLGVIGFFGGIGFLAPYLFIISLQSGGDMKELLLGKGRASR